MIKVLSSSGTKSLSWLFLSNIVKSFSQWVVMVILVKFFREDEVGLFTYGLAIAAPVFMFSDMQLKSVLVVEQSKGKDDFLNYILLRCVTTILAVLGLSIFTIIKGNSSCIITLVVGYKAAESLLDILYGYLQKTNKMVSLARLDILKSIIAILICIIISILFNDILSSIASLIIVSLCFVLINWLYLYKIIKDNAGSPKWSRIIDILKKCFPLGVSVLLLSYITNYPRIVIGETCGVEMLAYYGAYSYLVIGVFQVSNPLQTLLRQRLSLHYQQSNKKAFVSKIKKSVFGLALYGTAFIIAYCMCGKWVITTLYKDSYVEHSDVVMFLVISQMFLSITGVFATAVLSFNIYTKQVFISMSILIVVVCFTGSLINQYGIYGGAYVSIIAAVLSLSCYSYLFANNMKRWVG